MTETLMKVEKLGALNVALAENESAGGVVAAIAEASGALDFLVEEPDLYRDADIIPGRANPAFRRSRDVQAG